MQDGGHAHPSTSAHIHTHTRTGGVPGQPAERRRASRRRRCAEERQVREVCADARVCLGWRALGASAGAGRVPARRVQQLPGGRREGGQELPPAPARPQQLVLDARHAPQPQPVQPRERAGHGAGHRQHGWVSRNFNLFVLRLWAQPRSQWQWGSRRARVQAWQARVPEHER